jgi:hypothetical protein
MTPICHFRRQVEVLALNRAHPFLAMIRALARNIRARRGESILSVSSMTRAIDDNLSGMPPRDPRSASRDAY